MINRPIDQITEADIEALVADQIREGLTLDYKEIPIGGKDSDKKEFCKDVSSFANASGGDIVFGVAEARPDGKPTGIPERIVGLPGFNFDQEQMRLDGIIRTGIAPRINGVRYKLVEWFQHGPVLVMRVPKSWAAPHMICQDDSRFYSRQNNGKFALDVVQIRSAFALSESLPEKIRRFRDERIGRIIANEIPAGPISGAKLVIHLFPVSAADPATNHDLSGVAPLAEPIDFLTQAAGVLARFNLDGFLRLLSGINRFSGETEPQGYLQIFRNGCVEFVDSSYFLNYASQGSFQIEILEHLMFQLFPHLTTILDEIGASTPIFVLVSAIGVRGFYLYTRHYTKHGGRTEIDRDVLLLPDVVLEAIENDPKQILKPILDALWQASGWQRCMSYKEDGTWRY